MSMTKKFKFCRLFPCYFLEGLVRASPGQLQEPEHPISPSHVHVQLPCIAPMDTEYGLQAVV